MNFSNFKVSTRLALGFGLSVTLGVTIAIIGTLQMRSLATQINELANDRMPKVDKLTAIKDNVNAQARAVRNVLLINDPVGRAAEIKKIIDTRTLNAQLVAELDKVMIEPQARALLKVIVDIRPQYAEAMDRALALAAGGDVANAALLLFGEVSDKRNILFKAIEDSTSLQADIAIQLGKDAADGATASAALLLVLAAAMAVLGGLISWALTRSLSRALGAEPAELSVAVQRVADGDLATPVALRPGDDSSSMAAVARMHEALAAVVSSVRSNSESVATASAQIAQGNQDLSSRTEQQASALEETAASIEQINGSSRHNADNAAQADQLALKASTLAQDGGRVVGEVVQTMRQIEQASRQIVDIISVIDGIAFQTNILALNAAVEAARAGEQGRGFAVVASEVRSLAQRSADAAKQIKTLINTTVERVEQGSAQVARAGGSMQDIVGAIQRVNDIVGEIASASREQMSGVSQVSEAVNQMDKVTQQNAALVEESAAAAESLHHQADALVSAVAVFKLVVTHQPTRPTRPTPRPTARATAQQVIARATAQRPAAGSVQQRGSVQPKPVPAAATGDADWASF